MTEQPTRPPNERYQSDSDSRSAGDIAVRVRAEVLRPDSGHGFPIRDSTFQKAALMAGRIIFGGYFLYNGINHLRNRQMLAPYARAKGTPAADLAVSATGVMLIAGGASVIAGTRPKLGAGLIAAFLLGVSPRMHAFWKEQDPQQRMAEMVNFTKNMALVGSTLLLAAFPEPWAWHIGSRSRGALPTA
jgi:uncharacterized membrane protein YphA (DoxX/SURF4 family)